MSLQVDDGVEARQGQSAAASSYLNTREAEVVMQVRDVHCKRGRPCEDGP